MITCTSRSWATLNEHSVKNVAFTAVRGVVVSLLRRVLDVLSRQSLIVCERARVRSGIVATPPKSATECRLSKISVGVCVHDAP